MLCGKAACTALAAHKQKGTSTFFLFSKSGVTDDCRSAVKKTDCTLVSLADMKLGGVGLL